LPPLPGTTGNLNIIIANLPDHPSIRRRYGGLADQSSEAYI
jgi:hypothetical protein